jgi:hypothetical protein
MSQNNDGLGEVDDYQDTVSAYQIEGARNENGKSSSIWTIGARSIGQD